MVSREAFTDWTYGPPADDSVIRATSAMVGHSLPSDYVAFMQETNGGEGFVTEDYIVLFRLEELAPFNRDYEVDRYAPGFLLFGTNGGGEGYAFDTRDASMPVVRIPLIGMEPEYAIRVASSFTELIRLASDDALKDIW